MSYNIRHGLGCDGVLDLERIAAVIESVSPDVVGLNEVDVRFHRRSGWADQLGWLSRRLKMASCFGPTLRRRDRKSTRLNSSHVKISYAVFCLKKKRNHTLTLCT